MRIERRTFLAAAAAGPVIYGMHDLLGTTENGHGYEAALRRMKETRRYGIVLIVPTDRRKRETLGTRLRDLLDGAYPDAHTLFCEAVFICLTPDLARRHLGRTHERPNRLLLDPDGRVVDLDQIAPPSFHPKEFGPSFAKFLHGKDGARLEGQVRAIEKTLPDKVRAALTRLDDPSVSVRSEASETVFGHADRMIPYLVHRGRNGRTPEERSRCRSLIEEFFRASRADQCGPRLPYGATRATVSADPCPACGLAVGPVRSRKLLRFLTS